MRTACVQFDVQLGDRAGNERRAAALLAEAVPTGGLDFVLLPELAFVGYCFRDAAEIAPFAETLDDSPTVRWCGAVARRYGAHVAAGFVERTPVGVLHNSLAVVAPDGALAHVHRKHFLFETDKSWATPGDGFANAELAGLGRCGFALCMDLNSRDFSAPFTVCPFAESLDGAPWAFAACNWLAAAPTSLPPGWREDFLLAYWRARLRPAWGAPATFILANRVGVERGVRFAGCSAALDLATGSWIARLGPAEEGVLLVET